MLSRAVQLQFSKLPASFSSPLASISSLSHTPSIALCTLSTPSCTISTKSSKLHSDASTSSTKFQYALSTQQVVHKRYYHVSKSLKRKEAVQPNQQKQQQNQARKTKEITTQDEAMANLTEEGAPAYRVFKAEEEARKKAEEAGIQYVPDSGKKQSAIPDQVDWNEFLNPSTPQQQSELYPGYQAVEKAIPEIERKYPALAKMMKYAFSNMNNPQIMKIMLEAMDTETIRNDPIAKPMYDYWDQVRGRGDAMTQLRSKVKMWSLSERMKLQKIYRDINIQHAQSKSYYDAVDALVGPSAPGQKETGLPTSEESVQIMEDPLLIQIARSMATASSGTPQLESFGNQQSKERFDNLDEYFDPSPFTDMESLNLMDRMDENIAKMSGTDMRSVAKALVHRYTPADIAKILSRTFTPNGDQKAEFESDMHNANEIVASLIQEGKITQQEADNAVESFKSQYPDSVGPPPGVALFELMHLLQERKRSGAEPDQLQALYTPESTDELVHKTFDLQRKHLEKKQKEMLVEHVNDLASSDPQTAQWIQEYITEAENFRPQISEEEDDELLNPIYSEVPTNDPSIGDQWNSPFKIHEADLSEKEADALTLAARQLLLHPNGKARAAKAGIPTETLNKLEDKMYETLKQGIVNADYKKLMIQDALEEHRHIVGLHDNRTDAEQMLEMTGAMDADIIKRDPRVGEPDSHIHEEEDLTSPLDLDKIRRDPKSYDELDDEGEAAISYGGDRRSKIPLKPKSSKTSKVIPNLYERLQGKFDTKAQAHDVARLTQAMENMDSLPSYSPVRMAQDSLEGMAMAKQAIFEYNEHLLTITEDLSQVFADAEELTRRDLDERPQWLIDFEAYHSSVTGQSESVLKPTQLEEHDILSELSKQMQEKISLNEARSKEQLHKAALEKSFSDQLSPIAPDLSQYGPTGFLDPGVYILDQASEAETLAQSDQRLYVSSSENIDSIFTYHNIGKYAVLTDHDIKKYFAEGLPKSLATKEFEHTKKNAFLIRHQTLEAINNLRHQLSNSFVTPSRQSILETDQRVADEKKKEALAPSMYTPPKDFALDDQASRPMILYGYRGCGKSSVLAETVYWARRSGWLVIYVPDVLKTIAGPGYLMKNSQGLWDQPKQMVQFFKLIVSSHHEQLKQIKLKSPAKVGRLEAKTLFDICEYGSVLEQFSSHCFQIFKRELRLVNEMPVLIAVDNYNGLYNPCTDWSDPESTRYHKAALSPERLTLGEFFYNAHLNTRLGHGTFIGAVSETIPMRRFMAYEPNSTSLGYPIVPAKWLEVTPYTLNEFNTVMEHYKLCNWVRTKMTSASSSQVYVYQLTSGFGSDVWHYTKKL